jgi:hypothetical protein
MESGLNQIIFQQNNDEKPKTDVFVYPVFSKNIGSKRIAQTPLSIMPSNSFSDFSSEGDTKMVLLPNAVRFQPHSTNIELSRQIPKFREGIIGLRDLELKQTSERFSERFNLNLDEYSSPMYLKEFLDEQGIDIITISNLWDTRTGERLFFGEEITFPNMENGSAFNYNEIATIYNTILRDLPEELLKNVDDIVLYNNPQDFEEAHRKAGATNAAAFFEPNHGDLHLGPGAEFNTEFIIHELTHAFDTYLYGGKNLNDLFEQVHGIDYLGEGEEGDYTGCIDRYGCINEKEDVAKYMENVWTNPEEFNNLLLPSNRDKRYVKKLAILTSIEDFEFFSENRIYSILPENWLAQKMKELGWEEDCITQVTGELGWEAECINN